MTRAGIERDTIRRSLSSVARAPVFVGARMMKPAVTVPCNGCTACCKHDLIILHPEHGDKAEDYQTIDVINPITKQPAKALARQANGWCIYLGATGCTIHGSAPVICKEFDCRRFVQMIGGNRKSKRRAASQNDVIRAGLDRMDTL